jgi:hypothetical protein
MEIAMQLVKYEAACRAVAEARTIDEVKEISNRAEAARAYARQAKNKSMEIDAIEIRTRAERRLGEMIISLKQDGVVGSGKVRPIRLADLGIDLNISAGCQRLAMLPVQRFDQEISDWRTQAETSRNLTIPLQNYRLPNVRGDRQKVSARRNQVDGRDALDKYRAPDGRRIADWRAGELSRLASLARRMLLCAERLQQDMPLANPDPMATVEMIYRGDVLLALLDEMWDSADISASDAGLKQARIDRVRRCEQCGNEFILTRSNDRQGRFCSRSCSMTYLHAKRKSSAAEAQA